METKSRSKKTLRALLSSLFPLSDAPRWDAALQAKKFDKSQHGSPESIAQGRNWIEAYKWREIQLRRESRSRYPNGSVVTLEVGGKRGCRYKKQTVTATVVGHGRVYERDVVRASFAVAEYPGRFVVAHYALEEFDTRVKEVSA